jgi:hypothetical protein
MIPPGTRTFDWQRAEVLAALVNGLLISAIALWVLVQAADSGHMLTDSARMVIALIATASAARPADPAIPAIQIANHAVSTSSTGLVWLTLPGPRRWELAQLPGNRHCLCNHRRSSAWTKSLLYGHGLPVPGPPVRGPGAGVGAGGGALAAGGSPTSHR